VSSNQDFGVKQFFRADEFRADDPSPFQEENYNFSKLWCCPIRITCSKSALNVEVFKGFFKNFH
jgi:hypothetical protein